MLAIIDHGSLAGPPDRRSRLTEGNSALRSPVVSFEDASASRISRSASRPLGSGAA
jgi:hypothetical protein